MLKIIFERVSRLDVHKKTVVATRMCVTAERPDGMGNQDLWHHNARFVAVA